jgi:hypothetical protein
MRFKQKTLVGALAGCDTSCWGLPGNYSNSVDIFSLQYTHNF